MAITDSDYLHIQGNDGTYLLLRSNTHFHLVRVNAALTEGKMQRLLRLYPCDTKQLQEMGVHFSAFKAERLRGVVVKGYKTGDLLELWIGEGVREYRLGSDYSWEALAVFFDGYLVQQRMPPRREGLEPERIRRITWVVNGVSFACGALFWFCAAPYRMWSALCVGCQLLALALAFLYPASFSLAEESRKKRDTAQNGKGHLILAVMIPGGALCIRTLTDFNFRDKVFWPLLILAALVTALLCAIYFVRHRRTENGVGSAVAAVLLYLFLCMGTVSQLNYLLDRAWSSGVRAEVVDKELSRGSKSTTYYCTVELPNGQIEQYTVSAGIYKKAEIGEPVIVTHYEGAFGLPFSMVEAVPQMDE